MHKNRRSLWGGIGILFFGLGAALACGSASDTSDGKVCTAGAFVFCRCEDRSEGTKKCHDDGKGFDDCQCGAGTTPTPGDDAGFQEFDSGVVDAGGGTIDETCVGKLALISGAGGDADVDIFVAAYTGKGAFKIQTTKAQPMRSVATIVPILGEPTNPLLAVWRTTGNAIAWTRFAGGTWSAPATVGAPVASPEGPSLVTYQSKVAKMAYIGTDNAAAESTYSAVSNGWIAPVSINAGATGVKAPSIAAIAADEYSAYTMANGNVLVRMKSGGVWGAPVTVVPTAQAAAAAPAIVALDATNTNRDLLVVFTGTDQKARFTVRTANAWAPPQVVDAAAVPVDGVSLVGMTKGQALLAWRSADKHGHTSIYDAVANKWSAPADIPTGGAPELAGRPAVALAQCGGADATVAYAVENGAVGLVRYAGATVRGPYVVGGLPKATWVGVGELP